MNRDRDAVRSRGEAVARPGGRLHALSLAVLCLACLPQPLLAREPGTSGSAKSVEPVLPLTGRWAVRIVQPATGCDWVGEVRLNERSAVLTGEGAASATKASRDPRRCPPLKGEVNGSVRGEIVRFGFATGRLGKAEFEGRLVKQGREMQGSWTARSAAGQWAAAR